MRVVKVPSPNFFEPSEMRDNKIRAVVLHGTASRSASAAVDWLRNPQLNNPGSAVSANYVVSKAGVVYELVPWQGGLRAWANGIVENHDTSITWLNEAVKTKTNPNWITVSIEHEATQFEMVNRAPMTHAQFNASIDLTASLLKGLGLQACHETIISHSQISGVRKYDCPGVIFIPAYREVLVKRYKELGCLKIL
jgi:N-acetyl-anhydromuramyl-L-alanine amidase AmpD